MITKIWQISWNYFGTANTLHRKRDLHPTIQRRRKYSMEQKQQRDGAAQQHNAAAPRNRWRRRTEESPGVVGGSHAPSSKEVRQRHLDQRLPCRESGMCHVSTVSWVVAVSYWVSDWKYVLCVRSVRCVSNAMRMRHVPCLCVCHVCLMRAKDSSWVRVSRCSALRMSCKYTVALKYTRSVRAWIHRRIHTHAHERTRKM